MIDRLKAGKRPTTYLDEAALIHDIEYMNPYLTKDEADINMVYNLGRVQAILTATVARITLKLFNSLGSKEGSFSDYLEAKQLAYEKGFINPKMMFAKYV